MNTIVLALYVLKTTAKPKAFIEQIQQWTWIVVKDFNWTYYYITQSDFAEQTRNNLDQTVLDLVHSLGLKWKKKQRVKDKFIKLKPSKAAHACFKDKLLLYRHSRGGPWWTYLIAKREHVHPMETDFRGFFAQMRRLQIYNTYYLM